MNTKNIGEKSEGMCLAKFLQNGWVVLMPFGDNQRYDFVIDRGIGFERVQIKTGRIANGSIVFPTSSSTYHRSGGGRSGYRGQADLFGVYCPDNGQIYLVAVNDVGMRCVSLRVDASKNNQSKCIRWAKEFQI